MSFSQPPETTAPAGPIPEDNLPGHHPEHEQDKPEGPPPEPGVRPVKGKAKPKAKAKAERAPDQQAAPTATVKRRFGFAFEPRMAPFAFAVGVTPLTAWAEVAEGELRIRFGPWSAQTSLDNIAGAQVTGPYNVLKVVGPPRLSMSDGGATFATTSKRGVCIQFRSPITAAAPFGLLKHEGLTVTVDDPEGLVAALKG
jgi:hypothetical protein